MARTRIVTISLGAALAAIGAASAGTYLPGEGDIAVRVFQTTETHAFRELDTSPFTGHLYTNRAPIDVDTAEVRGTYSGLGVSMTDASAWILSKLAPEKRRAILEAVFSSAGANVRGVRLNIGSSDYSTALYNYDVTPGDVEMRHFSVARDDHWLFPMVKEALVIKPDIFLFAAPWSPPSWMKTTGNFVDGHFKDGMEQALANYLLAYVKACRERGLEIRALTFQNESALSTHGTYPSCVFTPEQGAEVTKLFVKGAREAGLATEAWIWDWDYHGATNAVAAQLADPELRAAASAVAWHSYSSMKPEMYALKKRYPEIRYYHTEMGPAIHDTTRRTEYWWCGKMREAFENGCEAFTSWNLCLTDTGEPLVGPHLCAGFLEVDLETGDFKPSAQYTVFRHVGPFVKPGAAVLKADGDEDGTNIMLFRNPDGTYVLVVACIGESPNPDKKKRPRPRLYVKYNGEHKYLPLPWGKWSVTTVVFKTRNGDAPLMKSETFDLRKNVKKVDAPPMKKTGTATAADKPLTAAEFLKKMNEGYRIGARNQLATSEEQRCVSLIAQAIKREWNEESFKWYQGLKPLQVSLKLGPGGNVRGFTILVGSGDADVDRTARSALNRLKSIPGLSATFLENFPEIALLMEPTQGE